MFAPAGTAHEITSIPVVAASLALASVATNIRYYTRNYWPYKWNYSGNAGMAVGSLIGNIIGFFVGTFIMVAIITIIYNFLAPRIGGIQLGLE